MHGNLHFPVKCFLFFAILSLSIFPNSICAQPPAINFAPVITTDLNTPVDVVNAGDNTNRLFIVSQKAATIRAYDAAYNFLGTLVTVSDVRTTGSEEGLLSMAFHPNYETNRIFFVYYTNTNGDLELASYQTRSSNPVEADPDSKEIILTISHPGESNHNGAKLNFGTDGYLYFATGDGGGGGDPNNNAQNGNSLLGKMLRINVDPGQTDPYTIPPTNPYITDPSVRDEIWAMGLRNPFRWSFDRTSGDMWIGDVGQGNWEEINYKSGPTTSTGAVNYGWRCFEGTHSYTSCVLGPGALITPVFEYANAHPSAVTGGIVYRGTEYTDLIGSYFAADFYSGNVYLIRNVNGSWTTNTLAGFPDWIAAFGEAESGALYAISLRGTLYKIQGAVAITPVTLVSFTGTERNSNVELSWETKNEVDVQQYEVEFSTNGTDFKQVGIVAATKSLFYRFTHTQNTHKKVFYRLRILDIDGRFEYSRVIQINTSTITGNFVSPTIITNHHLHIQVRQSYNQVQLINLEGKVVWQQKIQDRTGNLQFALPKLVEGTYLVRLIGSGSTLTQKVLIR